MLVLTVECSFSRSGLSMSGTVCQHTHRLTLHYSANWKFRPYSIKLKVSIKSRVPRASIYSTGMYNCTHCILINYVYDRQSFWRGDETVLAARLDKR
jgi:hypothetical protein